MRSIAGYLVSTIGRKQLMALAGIGLCLFVLSHVLGNFLVFVGPEAYNRYSHSLVTNPLLIVAELGLLTIFVLHTVVGVVVSYRNWRSRPNRYAVRSSGDKGTPIYMRTMFWQGVVIFVFVVLHLVTFKYGPVYRVTYGEGAAAVEMRDLFRLMYEVFQKPGYVAWYVVAVLILAFHLAHGLYSSLQTLGLYHPSYTPTIKAASIFYGAFIGLGFASQPLYMMFFYKG